MIKYISGNSTISVSGNGYFSGTVKGRDVLIAKGQVWVDGVLQRPQSVGKDQVVKCEEPARGRTVNAWAWLAIVVWFFFLFGFLLPYLVSYRAWEAVGLGVVLLLGSVAATIRYLLPKKN